MKLVPEMMPAPKMHPRRTASPIRDGKGHSQACTPSRVTREMAFQMEETRPPPDAPEGEVGVAGWLGGPSQPFRSPSGPGLRVWRGQPEAPSPSSCRAQPPCTHPRRPQRGGTAVGPGSRPAPLAGEAPAAQGDEPGESPA